MSDWTYPIAILVHLPTRSGTLVLRRNAVEALHEQEDGTVTILTTNDSYSILATLAEVSALVFPSDRYEHLALAPRNPAR